MTFNPLHATGMVFLKDAEGEFAFSGSCFLFREDNVLLTAAHCVPESISTVIVHLPFGRREMKVETIHRHPTADVAMLICGDQYAYRAGSGYPESAFWDGASNFSLGEQFSAFGYPSEGPSFTSSAAPTPRFFTGYYQRFFDYESHDGYKYYAGELSIPAPGGLSGGPIFRPGAPEILTGLVTANSETYAVTDSIDDVLTDGTKYRQESRRVLTYGVGLMLSEIAQWLHTYTPNPVSRGWTIKDPITGDDPTDRIEDRI
ncbi:serine protease [Paenarthrobacter sp. NPDC090522]|uniref:S1 family peptidase n=1 Tax=Paenarthrobacter sp. NPDC090522 TaxID=3364383 RepID=UPI00380F7DC4